MTLECCWIRKNSIDGIEAIDGYFEDDFKTHLTQTYKRLPEESHEQKLKIFQIDVHNESYAILYLNELTCSQWSAAGFIFECTVLGNIIEMQSRWACVQVWISINTLYISVHQDRNEEKRQKKKQLPIWMKTIKIKCSWITIGE